ncbi:MAG TPA: cyclic nucleotide-binding domain-containing protein [Acidimicrobiia bacterium]|nr:cyclic nucleotide-binding domain-containing protein [Acidimicrobiia bacterium]
MGSSIAAFRRVIRNRRLRRLLGSFFVFVLVEMGTWVAILVWAHSAGGPGFVGLVAAIQLVFAAVAAPLLSTIGDRLPRGQALFVVYAAVAVTSAVTGLALIVSAPVVVVLILASIDAGVIGVGRPIHASLIPDLSSEPADAVAANVASSALEGAGTFLGPALAGAVLLVSGPGTVFVVLGIGMLVAALSVSRMGHVARSGMLTGESEDGILAAFRTLARIPTQRFVVVLGGVSQIVVGALDVLTIVLAIEVLGLGESGAGFTVSLLGLGGLLGGVLAASMVGRRLGPILVLGALLRGGALVMLGVQPAWIALFLVSGAGFSLVDVGVRTLLQRLVPPDVMARTFGVLESVGLLGLAGGSLLASGLIAAFGVEVALMVFGGLVPLAVALGHRLLVAADRAADVPGGVIDAFQGTRLFGLLAPPTLEMLARRSRILQLEPGTRVIAEGETSRFVLLLVEGTVSVTKAGRHLADLEEGDVVGEIASLQDVPRTATVTTITEVTAISVPGDAFVMAVRGTADAWSLSTSVAGRRLAHQHT